MFKQKNKAIENNGTRPGLVTISKPTAVVSEQFRTIRTNIQFSMVDKDLKTLVVTSAGPGSGKSLVSANLAATFASEEMRVLLVDADLRKPTVHRTFHVKNNDGLTSVLTDKTSELTDMIYRTYTEGLYILTSGAIPPNPAELLNSNRMKEITKEMEGLFDLIIFDTPPVLAVTDAQVMSSKVDGTLFVIPHGRATKDEVTKAKELLDMVGANVLGAIFNRVSAEDDKYSYYYANEE
ncbi:CpsD/CapB family tyrosine-protein kinase [Lacticigenium naphthae]|uniref:CpsD/CapB family tyrosine-protein kinase n=1 Tax=Lacticigenium naphthae TaxID=515351 RepID=UPI0004208B77|nr:CpsD/CapB family tyrosine-protein kinase [Lacticigenium naphthae]